MIFLLFFVCFSMSVFSFSDLVTLNPLSVKNGEENIFYSNGVVYDRISSNSTFSYFNSFIFKPKDWLGFGSFLNSRLSYQSAVLTFPKIGFLTPIVTGSIVFFGENISMDLPVASASLMVDLPLPFYVGVGLRDEQHFFYPVLGMNLRNFFVDSYIGVTDKSIRIFITKDIKNYQFFVNKYHCFDPDQVISQSLSFGITFKMTMEQDEHKEVLVEKVSLIEDTDALTYEQERIVLTFIQKGMDAFYNEEYKEALTQYLKVVTLLPDYVIGYKRIGSIYYLMGKNLLAKEFWTKALALDPNDKEIIYFLNEIK